jgi:beta-lactamase superfamily II metal-dependent hydrolase
MIHKLLLCTFLACALAAAKPLTIYWIDVEGGAATLLVTPAGESILIDTGDRNDRDPARIADVAKQAGLSRIDHVILTHWHPDHFGGIEGLSRRIPLGSFYDHGVLPTLPENPQQYAPLKEAYLRVTGGHSTAVGAGDRIPLRQDGRVPLVIACMASNKKVAAEPGAKPNPLCARIAANAPDQTDNANSLALRIVYGRFTMFDGGDLTRDIEQKLACPNNVVGPVTLYQADGHGMDVSNDATFVHSLRPRVVVVNNGPTKGGEPESMKAIFSSPGLETVWEGHRNIKDPGVHNTEAKFIANEKSDCAATFIKAVVEPAGGFTVQTGAAGTLVRYEYR